MIVVEHDRDVMLAADHLVDMGPGAGEHGGQIVSQGTVAEVKAHVGTPTADYLAGRIGLGGPDPLTGGATGNGPALFANYRRGQCKGMQKSLDVIVDVHEEWAKTFGRSYAPLVEEYRLDDAEYALVTMGGMSGTAKVAVDAAREAGEKVGLLKIKTFRPFPLKAVTNAVGHLKAVGIVDRSVSFGWNAGPVYQEMLSAMYFMRERIPAVSFIAGLAGADITLEDFSRIISTTAGAVKGEIPEMPVWLSLND